MRRADLCGCSAEAESVGRDPAWCWGLVKAELLPLQAKIRRSNLLYPSLFAA